MKAQREAVIRPHLVKTRRHLALGDLLQRLARISPDSLYAIRLIAMDALDAAERRHQRYRPNDPLV